MPIIRVTKELIEKAKKARKAALLKDPEFRAYDERQELRRQAASKQIGQIENANNARRGAPSNDLDFRLCDERQREAGGFMSCLDATFTLTPKSPYHYLTANRSCELLCNGADFDFTDPADFSTLYTNDRFFLRFLHCCKSEHQLRFIR